MKCQHFSKKYCNKSVKMILFIGSSIFKTKQECVSDPVEISACVGV